MGFGHFSGNRFRVIALESSGELSYLLSLRIKLFNLLQSIINYLSRPSRQIVYITADLLHISDKKYLFLKFNFYIFCDFEQE